MTITLDRHGHVVKTRKPKAGRKSRKSWLDREVDRYRAGLLSLEGLVEAGMSELGWKYSPDQPRVPAGSSEGGRWASGGAGAGGMTLAMHHKELLDKLAKVTNSRQREHALVIGADGNPGTVQMGDEGSVRIPMIGKGAQAAIHTHPKRPLNEITGPSPEDLEAHLQAAEWSKNDNFTSVVIALDPNSSRVKVFTIRGRAAGGSRQFAKDLYADVTKYVEAHRTEETRYRRADAILSAANRIVRSFAEKELGLIWEEAWLD